MDEPKPSPAGVSAEVERKLRRLSVVLAAQLPSDSIHAEITLRFVAEIVQGYSEPGRIICLKRPPLAG